MIAMIGKSIARITVVLILIFLLTGLQFSKPAEANPFWIYHLIEPIPGTIPPKIIMFSPQNSTVYSSDNITISFYVDKPKLELHDSSIINITYTLDGKTVQAFTIWKDGGVGSDSGNPNFNTSFTSAPLSTGNHNLTVYAEGVLFAGGLAIFFMNSSTTIFFTINTPSLEASPAPTTSSLIPTPTAIGLGSTDSSSLPNLELMIAVIVVACVCLIVGLLLKRKHEVKR
jgi:hypothetical protein